RDSSDLTPFRHSSPSFGSQQECSYSDLSINLWTGRCTGSSSSSPSAVQSLDEGDDASTLEAATTPNANAANATTTTSKAILATTESNGASQRPDASHAASSRAEQSSPTPMEVKRSQSKRPRLRCKPK
ncbi:hypothetical protein BC830DRAFT_1072789, partial [Chytriomyces sp. MP71]